jgi:ATP-dependent RNA/DNA helicase IGHMBP2
MTDSSIHRFVEKQRRLLDLELKYEEEEERSIASNNGPRQKNNVTGDESPAASHVLRLLDVSEVSVGLYGRTVVTLIPLAVLADDRKSSLLPAHRFTVGDEVEIFSKQSSGNGNQGGVISAVTDTSISVALFGSKHGRSRASEKKVNTKDNDDDDGDDNDVVGAPPLSLLPKSSVEVHRKLVKALEELQTQGVDHPIAGRVIRSLFGKPEQFPSSAASLKIEPVNPNLDPSQLEAIAFALDITRPIACIHGPPGTGKTTTVAELIHQAVFVHKMKVLVTAPSNVAVDNVLERLVDQSTASKSTASLKRNKRNGERKQSKLKAVRLGHPARIKASILPYSLESLVQNADGTEIVADVRHELEGFLRVLSNPRSRGADKRVAYREVKSLRKEVKSREEKVVKDLVAQAQVVLATNVGAANRILDRVEGGFDLVVIDEAAQALEASCWIPILRGKRVVLAGDHCQLPPTIKSNASEVQKCLSKTLFERTMELYGDSDSAAKGKVSRMLRVQYRMHEDIANWASTAMYHGNLESFEGVKSHKISELDHICVSSSSSDDIKDTTLLLIDTTGCGMHETVNDAGSRYNEGEANMVAHHVRSLIELGLRPEEIAVVSPYNGQVELLRNMLLQDIPKLEIKSVDGFQGGEREAVILSLVRSSDRGGADGIGFLKDNRRLNVAVTRARRQCVIVCDCETVSHSNFIKGLIEWFEEHGEYRSAAEYDANGDIERDALDAEAELIKIMEGSVLESIVERNEDRVADKKLVSDFTSKEKLMATFRGAEEAEKRVTDEEAKRSALLDKISHFAETGEGGNEMRLSSELSRFDRKVVHEFATQLGLGHRSEGVDGVDRRITLKIAKKRGPSANETQEVQTDDDKAADQDIEAPRPSIFETLHESSDESEDNKDEGLSQEPEGSAAVDRSQMNQVLASLAEERRQRQEIQQQVSKQKSKTKKGKPKKLGGNRATPPVIESLDDLDDMAFLDAQIDQVQNSHGRKVEGKGSYRSIVNGILIGKPPDRRETRRNVKSSSALNAKLKQAQEGRKKKVGKKK